MQLDLDHVRSNVRQATTEDLMDRATVYREEMEADALEIIDKELAARCVSAAALDGHARERRGSLRDACGMALRCSICARPAVRMQRGWHRLWGVMPLFRRDFYLCEEHAGALAAAVTSPSGTCPRPPA
jgi:hypothetical protein